MSSFSGETTPAKVKQNLPAFSPIPGKPVGSNDITAAKAVVYTYIVSLSRNDDLDDGFYFGWEENLLKEFKRWEAGNEAATFYIFTIAGLRDSFIEDITYDFSLVSAAILLVCVYTTLFLGNISPTHCRCVVALVGLLSVGLCYASGFGFMYYCGG